jgi:thymidylate kinase
MKMVPAELFVMATTISRDRPLVVSFSGIDGAGKSTQIGLLYSRLSEAGTRVRLLAFWDDVAAFAQAREFLSHALLGGENGVGSPGKPVRRRDKNVRGWYMTAARFALYFLDALRLSAIVARVAAHNDADVIIFDRYLYDELANLDLGSHLSRAYVRLLLKLVPHPHIAFLLDADPVQAHHRKPEYGVDFASSNRCSYLVLSGLAGGITVIPPVAADEVARLVLQQMSQRLPGNPGSVSRDLLTST